MPSSIVLKLVDEDTFYSVVCTLNEMFSINFSVKKPPQDSEVTVVRAIQKNKKRLKQ